jgi:hypothetical protein
MEHGCEYLPEFKDVAMDAFVQWHLALVLL